MSTDQSRNSTGKSTSTSGCVDRAAAVTRSLLGYGVLAGLVYLATSLVQALTRGGFDLTRHDVSLLANGPLGWVEIANFAVSGAMTIAAAVGTHRALRGLGGGVGATWGPRLIAAYGFALVLAGLVVADPMDGFPPGTPDGPPATVTASGVGHLVAGGLGFLCLVAATVVLARHHAARGRNDLAWVSRGAGLVVLLGFLGAASGTTSPLAVLGLWVGVVVGWVWLGWVSVDLYRRTPVLLPSDVLD